MQCFEDGSCLFLTYSPAFFIAHAPCLPFDFVQATNRVQCLFGQLAFVRRVKVEELAPGVGYAANFGDALLEAGLVASEVVADQLAIPLPQKIARMLAGTAGAEVVHHGLQIGEGRGAVGPDVGPMGFLLAWREHLHRGFIGVDYALGQHGFAQGIDQRLELHAGLSDPLRQCRASNGQPGTAKYFLLPVQRQVVGELGRHHVSQESSGGDALVDHLGRHGCLDQYFSLATGPFPTHVLFNGEHARRVIQLFADVFTDALQLAAAGALGVLRLVTDHGARKLRWQRCALGLLPGFGLSNRRIDCFQLRLDGGDVGVEQVIQQAALVRAQLLATLGELVPFEQGNFMGELLDDGLIAVDLFAHRIDLREQLRG